MHFPHQAADLRRSPLVARASRLLARSPWSAAPPIRFLFVDSRFRYRFFQRRPRDRTGFRRLLRLAVRSGSLRPTSPEDFHLLSMPMLGTPKSGPGREVPRAADAMTDNALNYIRVVSAYCDRWRGWYGSARG